MKTILKLEELAMFIASVYVLYYYGLKYENGFKFTQLGEIGKKSEP